MPRCLPAAGPHAQAGLHLVSPEPLATRAGFSGALEAGENRRPTAALPARWTALAACPPPVPQPLSSHTGGGRCRTDRGSFCHFQD